MCWTRSNDVAVEEHVLLLDPERVRVALPERVVEHARRAGETPPLPVIDGRDQLLSLTASTASASISTFQRGSSSAVTTHVAAGRIVAEDLAVRARHLRPVGAVGDEHPRAHDVVDATRRRARAPRR